MTARLYKYPFNEQMLIYVQRLEATACASLETWNEKMNFWVNHGANDAEEELKRMEDFRKAQEEVEQKKEKPMSQKMFKVV